MTANLTLEQYLNNYLDQKHFSIHLNKGQVSKSKFAFIKNCCRVLNYFLKTGVNNTRYTGVFCDEFSQLIKKYTCRNQVLDFLKNDVKIIEVCKNKDGKESYININEGSVFYNLTNVIGRPKRFKFTDFGWELLQEEINLKFLNKDKKEIQKLDKIKHVSPTQIIKQVPENQILFKEENQEKIIQVMNNNIELKLDPNINDNLLLKQYFDNKNIDKNMSINKLRKLYTHANDMLDMLKRVFRQEKCSFNYRMYSGLTSCPKVWRKYILDSDKDHIKQIFDIHSSAFNILPLVSRIVLLQQNRSLEQFEKEEKVLEQAIKKDIYLVIGGQKNRDKVKKSAVSFLNLNNESIKSQECRKGRKMIKNWMKQNIPIMLNILQNFGQYEQEKVPYPTAQKQIVKVSSFWKIQQLLQTNLMVNLNRAVENELNTKIYNLHDGIFAKENYCNIENKKKIQQIFENIKENLKEIINKHYKEIEIIKMSDEFMKKETPKTQQQVQEQKEIQKEVNSYFSDLQYQNDKDKPTILNLKCSLNPNMFRDYYENVYYIGKSPTVPDFFKPGSLPHKCWVSIMKTVQQATSDQNCNKILYKIKITSSDWMNERRAAVRKLHEIRKELYKKLEIIHDNFGEEVYLNMILALFKYPCYVSLLMDDFNTNY